MNVAIIGTGAYGMALASVFYNNKCNVKMWTNSEEEKKMLLKNGKSDKVVAVSILLRGVGNEVADKKALVHNCRFIKKAPHPKEIVAKLKSYGIGRGAVFYTFIVLFSLVVAQRQTSTPTHCALPANTSL